MRPARKLTALDFPEWMFFFDSSSLLIPEILTTEGMKGTEVLLYRVKATREELGKIIQATSQHSWEFAWEKIVKWIRSDGSFV